MLKDITLGQFFPGDSLLHRLDPRTKILCSLLFIVAVFLCGSFYSFALLAVFTVTMIFLSGISLRAILRGMKPLLFILIFTTLYNVFFYNGEALIADLHIVDIYWEGIATAVTTALRIVCLLTGSSVILTYTTSPIVLTDGLEQLLAPLAVLKLPVHDFAMMMTIALRFIPTLVEETDKIMSAQKARGSDFTSGGLIKRAKALIPVLIPLFISAFRRAGDLATAMECRCYRGGEGRTRMTKLKFSARDFVMLAVFVLFCVLAAWTDRCLTNDTVLLRLF